MYRDDFGKSPSHVMVALCDGGGGLYVTDTNGDSKTFMNENGIISFDFSEYEDFNVLTSFYYVYLMNEEGLPEDRTCSGIWIEIMAHYVFNKIDIFDIVENDNVADMGSFENDSNAYIWESLTWSSIKRKIKEWIDEKK